MADDLMKRGPSDGQRINVNEDYELRYWTKELGCSEARLKQAVSESGVMVADVRTWLSKH
jgi:hypothetical protein